jgi:hypothetical protein
MNEESATVALGGLPSPVSESATITALSLKARGKQKLCLDNAVGVPERLGDMPLRLMIVGNNPSDHAWSASQLHAFIIRLSILIECLHVLCVPTQPKNIRMTCED